MDVTNPLICQQFSLFLGAPLGFEPVASTLISLVRPQALPTLPKAIVVRKCTYPNLIVHSPKHSRHLNTKEVDGRGQSSDLPTLIYILILDTLFVGIKNLTHLEYQYILSSKEFKLSLVYRKYERKEKNVKENNFSMFGFNIKVRNENQI